MSGRRGGCPPIPLTPSWRYHADLPLTCPFNSHCSPACPLPASSLYRPTRCPSCLVPTLPITPCTGRRGEAPAGALPPGTPIHSCPFTTLHRRAGGTGGRLHRAFTPPPPSWWVVGAEVVGARVVGGQRRGVSRRYRRRCPHQAHPHGVPLRGPRRQQGPPLPKPGKRSWSSWKTETSPAALPPCSDG